MPSLLKMALFKTSLLKKLFRHYKTQLLFMVLYTNGKQIMRNIYQMFRLVNVEKWEAVGILFKSIFESLLFCLTPTYTGAEVALTEPRTNIRIIFGKPTTRLYRRMAVTLAYTEAGIDVDAVKEKATANARDARVVSWP